MVPVDVEQIEVLEGLTPRNTVRQRCRTTVPIIHTKREAAVHFAHHGNNTCEGAELLVLVKPQFEVGRDQVGKGGVVRDPALRNQAVESVAACARALGYEAAGSAPSRLTGPKGNQEIFLRLLPESADAEERSR